MRRSSPAGQGDELTDYETEVRSGPIGRDLKKVRNVKPCGRSYGLIASLMGGASTCGPTPFGLTVLGTLRHGKSDAKATGKAKDHKKIDYPGPMACCPSTG
jgi:electron-transferring-flavoprotein dehydrogenase